MSRRFSVQIESDVPNGTAPMIVDSSTLITNFNADLLDGQHGSYYQNAGNLNNGTILAARMPALTGDITTTVGTVATTLANTTVTAASYGSASAVSTFTVDAKGRLTAASNAAISIAQSAVTNLTSDLALKAPLASPALTGTPTSPTAAVDTNTTQIATTAYVIGQGYLKSSSASSTYAPIASPTFTGTVNLPTVSISGITTTSNYINRTAGNGNSSWLQQDGTGRVHWYWNTLGGTSPTFTNAAEDASALTLHVNNNGNGGTFFHRSANGASASAGGPITWTTTLYVDLATITYKGNRIPTVTDKLNAFAATTSAELAGVISDETGSGSLVFNTSPTFSKSGVTIVQVDDGATISNTGQVNTLQVIQATVNSDAFMTFHIAGDYAAHFGIDGTTNDLSYGGWSAGANKYRVWHAGNQATLFTNPTFTGTPTAPTANAGTNTTQIATTAYVTTAVASAGSGFEPFFLSGM